MEIFAKKLREHLEAELNKIDPSSNAVKGYNHCTLLAKEAIDDLKNNLLKHPFTDVNAEVYYFKKVAPYFYSRYFYFIKLYNTESCRISSKKEDFISFLEKEEMEVKEFFRNRKEFCDYIYMGITSHDEAYFAHVIPANWILDDVTVIMDNSFRLASYRLSWLLANELYMRFLQKEMSVSQSNEIPTTKPNGDRKYTWHASDAETAEIIYGLKGKSSIRVNDREMSIKDFEIMFEDFFGKKLSNIYLTHLYNQRRKKDKTPYLHAMIQIITTKS